MTETYLAVVTDPDDDFTYYLANGTVVPVDLVRQLTDRIVESTRRAQALTLAANPESEHITELVLTHIHAEIWGIVSDALGIGGDE